MTAFSGDLDSLEHVFVNVVPRAGLTTILLLVGTGFCVAVLGAVAAWLVTFFEFPFRRLLQLLLVLPLAVPTYISAYAFVEFFTFTGPLQETVRWLGGYQSSREYWFPDIRSLAGAILVMSSVLYPYVYLTVRALFHLQGSNMRDTARMLGAGRARLFWSISLPLVRPAIALGVTLALMETLNDIGAVEHLGVSTLTFSIFSVWLNQGDLAGASQIALLLLLLVLFMIWVERRSRGNRAYSSKHAASNKEHMTREKLGGFWGWVATFACFLLVAIGFGIPVGVLGEYAWARGSNAFTPALFSALSTSFAFASGAALITVVVAISLVFALRLRSSPGLLLSVRLASSGYALPGTLVALGVFVPFAAFDNWLDGLLFANFGFGTGLLLSGTGIAMIVAYVIRFMAMAEGNLANGMARVPISMDHAARSLGRTQGQVLTTILLPLARPAILSAALLVFVEVIKELSATIVLRPFGVNTLATYAYDYASRARVEEAALPCLLIVAAGAVPVVLLLRDTRSRTA